LLIIQSICNKLLVEITNFFTASIAVYRKKHQHDVADADLSARPPCWNSDSLGAHSLDGCLSSSFTKPDKA